MLDRTNRPKLRVIEGGKNKVAPPSYDRRPLYSAIAFVGSIVVIWLVIFMSTFL